MLYTLTQIDLGTGEKTVIYESATENVISQYWEAYVNVPGKAVQIQRYIPTLPLWERELF